MPVNPVTPVEEGETEVQSHLQLQEQDEGNLVYMRPHLEREKGGDTESEE